MVKCRINKVFKPINPLLLIGIFGAFIFFLGCESQSRGFVLPEGNIEAGKLVFQNLECMQCHSIGDIEWTGPNNGLKVELGGKVTSLKTYGELVTSIINPSHKISKVSVADSLTTVGGESKMQVYNQVMSVQELIDIVAFLQSEYQLELPTDPYPYPPL